ncbi:hypothetical protein ACEPPN_017823 [Leptodophora sp. 'Broadleaf-Isolate-01']
MNASIPTHLAPGKRQMSSQGAIREIDRTIDRAPWISQSGQSLKLIRDEEEEINKSLHSNRHRKQEKDRVKAPENALRAAIRPLGWLNEDDKPDWQFTSIVHEGKELWSCQLFLGGYLVGTEDRQQRIAHANCQIRDNETQELILLWPQPVGLALVSNKCHLAKYLKFSHEAQRDMVTRLTPLDDMDGARDLFTCLRDDTATFGLSGLQSMEPNEILTDGYPFGDHLAGSKRNSSRELKTTFVTAPIRSKNVRTFRIARQAAYSGTGIYHLFPKNNLQKQSASGVNDQHLEATQISGVPEMNDMATQTSPFFIPHVIERVNSDFDQIASHFGDLVIRGPGEKFYSEMYQLLLNIQNNAVMQSSDSSQTDILTCKLVQL